MPALLNPQELSVYLEQISGTRDIADIYPAKDQKRNKGYPRTYTWKGMTRTAANWAIKIGICRNSFYERIQKWEAHQLDEELVFAPPAPGKSVSKVIRTKYEWKGEALTSAEWAKRLGITENNFYGRYSRRKRGKIDEWMVFEREEDTQKRLSQKRKERFAKQEES